MLLVEASITIAITQQVAFCLYSRITLYKIGFYTHVRLFKHVCVNSFAIVLYIE